jgi:hypothetical protein
MNKNYKFRNLPCNCVPNEQLWAVSGRYGTQGGILEWCTSQGDAERMLRHMRTFPNFKGLRAHKWQESSKSL